MAVEGLSAFQRKMALIPKAIIDEVRKELEKQATELVAMMRRLAPKDTGELANSIDWTWGQAPKGSIAIGTVAASEGSALRITIYAGNESTVVTNKTGGRFQKAKLQEFGTKNMPANPFFFPAYRSKRRKIRGALSRAVKRGIKNAI